MTSVMHLCKSVMFVNDIYKVLLKYNIKIDIACIRTVQCSNVKKLSCKGKLFKLT